MIPIVGEVCTALLRQRVEVLSINDGNTANVALVPGTPLPNNAVIIMNGVPFKYLASDTDE